MSVERTLPSKGFATFFTVVFTIRFVVESHVTFEVASFGEILPTDNARED